MGGGSQIVKLLVEEQIEIEGGVRYLWPLPSSALLRSIITSIVHLSSVMSYS